jgi:hypothetical protein
MTTAMPQSFRQQFMIVDNGAAFEEVFLCVLQGRIRSTRKFVRHTPAVLQGAIAEVLEAVRLLRGEARLLLSPDLFRGDFCELVGTRFADEHGNFIVGWLAAILLCELFNRRISLGFVGCMSPAALP